MTRDDVFVHDTSADEMFLDDPFENGRIASGVPRALGIDDRDRSAFADAQAVRLRPQDAALLRQSELFEPPFQKIPCRKSALLLAAFRVRLIAAEKDVAPRNRHADRVRDGALRFGVHQRAALYTELLRIPLQPELARRRHVSGERRRGDDRRARQIAFAADAHAILPVAIERGDRALTFLQRIGPLAEAGTAPRLADLAADGSKDVGNRSAVEPRVGPLDLTSHAAGSGKNDERLRRLLGAAFARDRKSTRLNFSHI